jgi:hypothetical protein
MQKYIVSKGWEGFGDRIQCLSNCIVFSLRFNRILFVDWTDTIWKEGFYRYFHFDNIAFTKDITEITETKTVHPEFWKHKLMLPANKWMYAMKEQLVIDPSKTYNFEDVWVHPGIGYREFDMGRLARYMRINPEIASLIYTEPINDPVVHLRGTDRKFKEEDWQELRKQAPIAHVLSDDASLIKRWLSESPESTVISNPKENITHFTIDVNKHEMNLALLKEFFILASAPVAFALNKESVFFRMARILGKCEDYPKMWPKNTIKARSSIEHTM